MHRLFSSLVLGAAFIAVNPAAQALTAAEVFAKTHHAVYLVIVTSDEPGVVDVVAQSAAARKPIAARLAPYQSMSDSNLPARIYEQMTKKGQLAGLDDNAAIRKVYEVLIRQHIAEQLKWNEGGNYVSEFQIQLRRSGEVMFVIPAKASGVERFDQEAQRAIGAASPLPVPQDNDAFAKMSEITIVVQAPERATQPSQPAKPVPKKKPK